MNTYRAAIIGCGKIGSEFDKRLNKKVAFSHAGAYSIHPRTELIAACDLNPVKLDSFRKKWKVGSVYQDYKEMLGRERIDILSICTPPETHWEIVKYASRFPISAIYCEKPISDNLKQAERIVRQCQEKRVLLTVNHQRRFHPFYQELKQKLSDGFIGKVQHANCYYSRGIVNTGIHIVDIFSFFFGKVDWIQAYYSKNNSPFKNDPNLDGLIKFKRGPLVTLKACDDAHYLFLEIDILTTKARLRLGRNFEYFQTTPGNNLLKKNELTNFKKPPFKSSYRPISLTFGVDHIIKCLEKKEKPQSSGRQAVYALKLIEKLLSSAKNGKRYFVDSNGL